jgi:hypothetical protein
MKNAMMLVGILTTIYFGLPYALIVRNLFGQVVQALTF